jgi:signal transduction histidine kinase
MNEGDERTFSLLVASSVHDIKNSLSMLLQTLEDVVRSTPNQSDEQRRQFATLQGEAVRINNDLMYFLGLYRLGNDQLPIHIESTYVADLLQEQTINNALLFEIRGLTLTLDCDDALTGYLDRMLIGGILNNVLVNAARYAHAAVTMRAFKEDNLLVIEVRDDGDGYPEKMLAQGNAVVEGGLRGIDFSTGSTNLGLHFAAQVAALHRRGTTSGYIHLSNLPAGGGCFRLVLP